MKKHLLYVLYLMVLSSMHFLQAVWSWKKVLPPLQEEELVTQKYTLLPQSTLTIQAQLGSLKLIPSEKNGELTITAIKRGIPEELPQTEIDLSLTEKNALIKTVDADPHSSVTVEYTIGVPSQVKKIDASSIRGPIIIENIDCPLTLNANNGNIIITNACRSVRAQTIKGSISLHQKKLAPTAALFLEAARGNVKLTLPKNIQALLNARTLKGSLKCLIPITLEPRTTVLTPAAWRRIEREARGTLGTQGKAPITIDVMKGNIEIKPEAEQ